MFKNVRVRIAPSPTGYVHLGNIYTAYYNYIFARQHKGSFIVRIDDTDQERHVADAEAQIYDLLHWFGLEWNEGPDVGGPHRYRQSERLERYQEAANQLIKNKLAYQEAGAIFLKINPKGRVEFDDLVRGHVVVEKSEIKDQVLIKGNGYPTYMFATVVDDADFGISHVIRAEDHLSNTAKQILIYEALKANLPQFAHLPLLRNADNSKLSKRQSHTSFAWYREQGFLPEALKNYFSLLGWTHPDQKDIFKEDEFIHHFTFEKMNTTAPHFDLDKLTWINGMIIRELSVSELAGMVTEYLNIFLPAYAGTVEESKEYLLQVVELAQERLKTLGEFWDQNKYFWEEPEIDGDVVLAFFETHNVMHEYLEAVGLELSEIKKWNVEQIETTMRGLQERFGLKPRDAFMSIRHIVTGQAATPSLFHLMEVLGKDVVVSRVEDFVGTLDK